MMSEARFTPGPWFVATGNSWRRILTEYDDKPVIVPTTHPYDGHPDLSGDGMSLNYDLQLAAAAPELYEALEYVHKIICDGASTGFNYKDGDWPERLFLSQRKTSAALRKARGEQ